MLSVMSRGGGTAIVVVATCISDTVDSCVVTFLVVVLQCVVAEVGADGEVVVGTTWSGCEVCSSAAGVVEDVGSVGVTGRILSVVTGGVVVSGLMYGVVLLMVKGATCATDSVVVAEVTIGRDTVPVSIGGEVRRGEEVVEAVLGKPGGIGVVVLGGSRSTVTVFVLVSVYAVVAELGTVVLSVTMDVSETGAGVGLEEVTIGVTAAECVIASVVSLVGWTAGGGVLMVVGPSTELVAGAAVVDVCTVVAVVVKSSCGRSVGLVVEVSQNRAVMAKGALDVLDMTGCNGLVVELTALVVRDVIYVSLVGRASVTLTVDSGSNTSGLTVGGAVGGDGGPAVLESSGAAERESVTELVNSSGAGGASDKVVCVIKAGVVVVNLVVGLVCEGVDSVVVVVAVVLRVVVEAAVLAVVAGVTATEVG